MSGFPTQARVGLEWTTCPSTTNKSRDEPPHSARIVAASKTIEAYALTVVTVTPLSASVCRLEDSKDQNDDPPQAFRRSHRSIGISFRFRQHGSGCAPTWH